jgi:Zn-dependent peptidase ImmA (M78 family)
MQISEARWVNPFILRWARERLNLIPEQVEAEAQELRRHHYSPVSVQELAKWEEGLSEPELEHLETLSEIYWCPVGYFFMDRTPEEPLPLSFRGLAQEKTESLSPTTHRTLRRFYELAQWTVDLIESLNIPWEVKVRPGEYTPDLALVDHIVQEKKTYFGWTKELRSRFEEDREEAFRWWRKAIEGEGIFCFEMKLEPDEVRGASLWINSQYPFILVNRQDVEAASGRIFTLLHEYAHLITDREGVVCDFRGLRMGQSPEPFGNRFAARMLLSPEELWERLREVGQDKPRENWSDRILDEIRRPFMVSRDVVTIMLQEMGLAPRDFYEKKREQWERRKPWGRGGKRPTKKELKLREMGYSLTNLLVQYSEHPSLPWLDVSYVLDMKVEKIADFIQWARQSKL